MSNNPVVLCLVVYAQIQITKENLLVYVTKDNISSVGVEKCEVFLKIFSLLYEMDYIQ